MLFSFAGKHLVLDYEIHQGSVLIVGMNINEASYLRSGFSHLVSDILNFIDLTRKMNVENIAVKPDRSAMRLTFEELGFRGDNIMVFEPLKNLSAPVLDYGRAGGVAPDVTIALEDGRELPAEAIEPGDILLGGGCVYDILKGKIRYSVASPVGTTSCLTVLISQQGRIPLRNFDVSQVQHAVDGFDMLCFSVSNRVLRANGYWIEDMWGSDQQAYSRRISPEQVIAALNHGDGLHA